MNNDTTYSILYILILVSVFGLSIFLKYFYFFKLRSTRSNKRFFKTFFRWYGSNDRDMAYDQAGRKKFMIISNLINIPFWIVLIMLLKLLFSFINTNFLSADN